ncbi:MAG: PilN domain-containing protein [Planctomycetes bacterium]|nr:PilN domain-containing protein [Planctomycetota bacterium]
MKLKTNNLLASLSGGRRLAVLLLGDRSVGYGLRRSGGKGVDVEAFTPEGEVSWDDPERLGAAFRDHLRNRGLSVRRVDTVIAACSATVLRTATLPPATDEALVDGMIATAVEEAFAERPDSLAYAYQTVAAADSVAVSIFGSRRESLARIEAFLTAAALTPRRIVPGPAALAAALDGDGADRLIFYPQGDTLTLVAAAGGRCRWQRDLPAGDDDLAPHLRRAALVVPVAAAAPLTLVGTAAACDLAETVLAGTGDHRRPVERVSLEALIALLAAPPLLRRRRLNLLASHALTRRPALRRGLRIGAVAAVVLLAALAALMVRWTAARRTIAQAQTSLTTMKPQLDRARAVQDLNRRADGWYQANLGYLDVLRALAEKFPEEGSIWLTTLQVDQDGQVTLAGQARTGGDVLALLSALQGDQRFTQLQRHFIRPQTGREPLTVFSVSYRYQGDLTP